MNKAAPSSTSATNEQQVGDKSTGRPVCGKKVVLSAKHITVY